MRPSVYGEMAVLMANALEVVPAAVVATDAAYTFGSRLVSFFLLVSLMVGSVVRAVLRPVAPHGPVGVLTRLEALLLPTVVCVSASWPSYYVGATLLLLFACLCLLRLPSSRDWAACLGAALVGAAFLVSAIAGLPVAADSDSATEPPHAAVAAVPCLCLGILVALMPVEDGERGPPFFDHWVAEVALLSPYIFGSVLPGDDAPRRRHAVLRGLPGALLRRGLPGCVPAVGPERKKPLRRAPGAAQARVGGTGHRLGLGDLRAAAPLPARDPRAGVCPVPALCLRYPRLGKGRVCHPSI
eukprot:461710-Hanusia_phi.AAC.6